jgi:hypothetical protein
MDVFSPRRPQPLLSAKYAKEPLQAELHMAGMKQFRLFTYQLHQAK